MIKKSKIRVPFLNPTRSRMFNELLIISHTGQLLLIEQPCGAT